MQAASLAPKQPLVHNDIGSASSSSSSSAPTSAGDVKDAASMIVATSPSADEVPARPKFLETSEGNEARACYDFAFAGDPEEQYNLGERCRLGNGVVRDDRLAYTWYFKASLKGNLAAQVAVADCYRNGIGVDRDIDHAIKLYAACYRFGIGVDQDIDHAIEWYQESDAFCQKLGYEKQRLSACYYLGVLYRRCRYNARVKNNDSKAHRYRELSLKYYQIAAEGGWAPAQTYLGNRCLNYGQVAEGLCWLQKAAAQHDADAIAMLEAFQKQRAAMRYGADAVREPVAAQATGTHTASNSTSTADSKEAVAE